MPKIASLRYKIAKTPLRSLVVWLRHKGLNPHDVYLGAYPRSGSTWVKFMLFEILSGQPAGFKNSDTAIPHVGSHYKALPLLPGGHRLIKTHEPYHNVYRKAIYLVRDVRDVALSEYTHWKWVGIGVKDFDHFLVEFLEGKTHGFGFGSWSNHVNSWLDAHAVLGEDILIIRFEDMRQKTEQILSEIVDFLGVNTDRQTIRDAINNNSIQKMREKEDKVLHTLFKGKLEIYSEGVRFVRHGHVGGWRQRLTDEQIQLIQKYTGEILDRLGYPT
jgi:hypothetical protein